MRHRLIAGLLSLVVAGMGQLYAGRWRRAGYYFAAEVVCGVIALFLIMHVPWARLNVLAAAGFYASFRLVVIVDAIVVAGDHPRHWYTRWYALAAAAAFYWLIGLDLIGFFVRSTCVRAYEMPSNAMGKTLRKGDRFLVDLLTYTDPRRRDVIAFSFPGGKSVDIGRIVALPGETIEGRFGKAVVDGKEIAERYAVRGTTHQESFGPYRIPRDTYFVMTDRRGRTLDRRTYGMVPRDHIIGRALAVYMSISDKGIYWRRIGKLVR